MENPELVVGSHELCKYLLIRGSEFTAVSNYTLFAKNKRSLFFRKYYEFFKLPKKRAKKTILNKKF